MTGKSLAWLVCFLNSSLSEYLFSKIGTTTGVGTVRWKKYTIEQLTVPNISEKQETDFTNLLTQVADGSARETDINRRIYALCKLTEPEIAFIENYAKSI